MTNQTGHDAAVRLTAEAAEAAENLRYYRTASRLALAAYFGVDLAAGQRTHLADLRQVQA